MTGGLLFFVLYTGNNFAPSSKCSDKGTMLKYSYKVRMIMQYLATAEALRDSYKVEYYRVLVH